MPAVIFEILGWSAYQCSKVGMSSKLKKVVYDVTCPILGIIMSKLETGNHYKMKHGRTQISNSNSSLLNTRTVVVMPVAEDPAFDYYAKSHRKRKLYRLQFKKYSDDSYLKGTGSA